MIGFRVVVALFPIGQMIAASAANAASTLTLDGGSGPSEAPYTHQLVVPLRIDDFACAGSTKIGAILGANIDYRFRVSGNDLFPAEDSPMFVK